jgi:2-polyprenyl-3-methyl-5-hydroxy-6-metoxy-1,4-benzoquinol methylase
MVTGNVIANGRSAYDASLRTRLEDGDPDHWPSFIFSAPADRAVWPRHKVLDIAVGSGSLSVPAAHTGASVTAIAIVTGMVDLLRKKPSPFPNCLNNRWMVKTSRSPTVLED